MQSCIRDTSTFPGIHMPHAAGPELGCYETFVRSSANVVRLRLHAFANPVTLA